MSGKKDEKQTGQERSRYRYKTRIGRYVHYLNMRVKRNEKAFRIYTVLRILVVITLIRCILEGNFESAMLCALSLLLFLLPSFLEEKLHVEVPARFQVIIYLFIYAAEILGEVNRFYTRIPGWDTMLHTINGFLCAAIGFSLVDLLNRSSNRIQLSPLYLSVVAFCFSMTIGVCWEFVEFFFDSTFYLDMQKDFVVQKIGSIYFDETHRQIPVQISGITKTIIETASGKTYTVEGGYLDIGIIDTMKDLLVNFVGAFVFSVIGYMDAKFHNRRAEKIANGLRVTRDDTADEAETSQDAPEQEEKN
ncbi:MAG: hypothetical protein ACI4OJ_06365 [Lachnospiraceae bacterium]